MHARRAPRRGRASPGLRVSSGTRGGQAAEQGEPRVGGCQRACWATSRQQARSRQHTGEKGWYADGNGPLGSRMCSGRHQATACVRVCVCACVRVCTRARVRVRVGAHARASRRGVHLSRASQSSRLSSRREIGWWKPPVLTRYAASVTPSNQSEAVPCVSVGSALHSAWARGREGAH